MFKFIKKIFGDGNDRAVKQISPLAQDVNALEDDYKALSDAELLGKTAEFKARLADGEALDDLLPEAFAAVREAAQRANGMRHYDVQLIGGAVLHQGKIAEMKTGEGKTLVATLPLYLNALDGKGAHLITVNDYLAKVGAGWMGPVYGALGMSVAMIAHDFSAIYDADYTDPKANPEDSRLVHWSPVSRRDAYLADITYGTNNEFGFDYLRDNMAWDVAQLVQRELHFAIVDEVDNILIDEARTPLIISGPAQESSEQYKQFSGLVRNLRPSPYSPDQIKKEFIEDPQGDFLIDARAKSIQITDQGIHKVERLLRMPSDESLYEPQHYEKIHFLENALRAEFIYQIDRDYIVEDDGEVVIVDEFTGRKMAGRRWSDGLHQAVEAKEGRKVRQENVTMATITFQNFFRMYHKLCGMTGTAFTEREELGKIYNLDVVVIPTHRDMVREDMDDQIFRSEDAKFNAVVGEVEQTRAIGRPVLVGTTSVETSERLSSLLKKSGIPHQVLNAKQHEREASVVAQAGRKGNVTIATNMAGRGTDILLGGNPDGLVDDLLEAKGVKFDKATPEQKAEALEEAKQLTAVERDEVRNLGGLHIIGTERHEARRIDNQLRGRAGRQGDPGSTRFFLSLEDDLMKRFGPMDRVKGLMERLGVDDEVPIEAGLINRSIEGAQTRVEGYNFDMRKHTVEFDDVMNKQRTIIYADRKAILQGEEMRPQILDMLDKELDALMDEHVPQGRGRDEDFEEWDVEALLRAVGGIIQQTPEGIDPEELSQLSRDEIHDTLMDLIESSYDTREQAIGAENMRFVERRMMLGAIDREWVEYLTGMEDLRQEIGLQAIAQKDPLIEYQRNASIMFTDLKENIQRNIVRQIIPATYQIEQQLRQIEQEQQQRLAAAQTAGQSEEQAQQARTVVVRRVTPTKIGRNDPCPCGSGKKFKDCHIDKPSELMAMIDAQRAAQTQAPKSVSAQLATSGSKPAQKAKKK